MRPLAKPPLLTELSGDRAPGPGLQGLDTWEKLTREEASRPHLRSLPGRRARCHPATQLPLLCQSAFPTRTSPNLACLTGAQASSLPPTPGYSRGPHWSAEAAACSDPSPRYAPGPSRKGNPPTALSKPSGSHHLSTASPILTRFHHGGLTRGRCGLDCASLTQRYEARPWLHGPL